MDPSSSENRRRLGSLPQACEQCHKRKIRCDKTSPCGNCKVSKLSCQPKSRRPPENRPKSHDVANHERMLIRIDEQLSSIQSVLEKIVPTSTHVHDSTTSSSTEVPGASREEVAISQPVTPGGIAKDSPVFEGESSLSSQSHYASRVFERAAVGDPLVKSIADITGALDSLEKVLNRDHPRSAFHENQLSSSTLRKEAWHSAKLPAVEDVVALLQWAKGPVSPSLLCFVPLITIKDLSELCRKAYFDLGDCSNAEFIILNACLSFLLPEFCSAQSDKAVIGRYSGHTIMCIRNLESALAGLSLFLQPTLENAKALLLGSMHALDVSSPSMAWTLVSTAARICQSLGYHRSTSMKDDSPEVVETKKSIFWYVYIMDKTLSLRLGRSSNIQEYDISLDMLAVSSDNKLHAWNKVWGLWIEAANIHGSVYEQLYSPRALAQSSQDRLTVVQRLSGVAISAQQKNSSMSQEVDQRFTHHQRYLDFVIDANEVVYLSLLTLIYRADTVNSSEGGSSFSDDCIITARAALQAHHLCSTKYRENLEFAWGIYLSWTLLSCPFIPFMVIFCHAVTSLSLDAVSVLETFVSSLEPTKHTPEPGRKMHRLCRRFHYVAKSYIDGRLAREDVNSTAPNHPSLPLSNPGFRAFDLVPQLDDWSSAATQSPDVMFGELDPPTDENWFLSDPYILDLLETDFSTVGQPS